MRIDVLEVVLRGAPPGSGRREGCHCLDRELRECRIVHTTHGLRDRRGYWRDLCDPCVRFLCRQRDLPAEKPKADIAWDALLKQLHEGAAESP